MRIKTLCSLGLATLLFTACGDQANSNNEKPSGDTTVTQKEPEVKKPTEADKIAAADALMQKIDAGKATQKVEKKRFTNNAMNMAHDQSIYTVYSESDKMVKLTELMGESMYLAEAAYYYQNGEIFLIHTKSSFDDIPYRETKVYFEAGKPFTAIGKSKKEDDETTDLATLKMEPKEASEIIHNMDEYMKGLAEIPKRLAASKIEK